MKTSEIDPQTCCTDVGILLDSARRVSTLENRSVILSRARSSSGSVNLCDGIDISSECQARKITREIRNHDWDLFGETRVGPGSAGMQRN